MFDSGYTDQTLNCPHEFLGHGVVGEEPTGSFQFSEFHLWHKTNKRTSTHFFDGSLSCAKSFYPKHQSLQPFIGGNLSSRWCYVTTPFPVLLQPRTTTAASTESQLTEFDGSDAAAHVMFWDCCLSQVACGGLAWPSRRALFISQPSCFGLLLLSSPFRHRRFSQDDVSSSSQVKSSVQRGFRAKLLEQFPNTEVRSQGACMCLT